MGINNIIYNTIESWKHISYTYKHYKSFVYTEKRLLGYYKYKFHDFDKLFMYIVLPFIGPKKISNIHRKYSSHHPFVGKQKINFEEAVIDWECARITKPDKPMNARDTCKKYYPEFYKDVSMVLNKLDL